MALGDHVLLQLPPFGRQQRLVFVGLGFLLGAATLLTVLLSLTRYGAHPQCRLASAREVLQVPAGPLGSCCRRARCETSKYPWCPFSPPRHAGSFSADNLRPLGSSSGSPSLPVVRLQTRRVHRPATAAACSTGCHPPLPSAICSMVSAVQTQPLPPFPHKLPSPLTSLQLPWAPLLTAEEVQQGTTYYGGGARLRAVAAKLLAGQAIKVFTLGGSVTYGHGVEDLTLSYPSRFFQFINASFPHRCA